MKQLRGGLVMALLWVTAGWVFGGGCGRGPAKRVETVNPPAFDGQRAYQELARFLAVGSRVSGTPGAAQSANYLAGRLKELGIESAVMTFTNRTPRGLVVFRNVIGRIPGRGHGLILLGSHYDTKDGIPGFQGANDSGSSTAVLLELGRGLVAGPKTATDIWLAFFDGEECFTSYGPADGFQGSRELAERLSAHLEISGRKQSRAAADPQTSSMEKMGLPFPVRGPVKAVIVLDMIGDKDLNVTFPKNGTPSLMAAYFHAAEAEGARFRFGLYSFEVGDDHEPFLQAGFPAVDVIDFEYGSAPGRNDYWHTPADTLDKISAESLALIGQATWRVVLSLP